MEDNRRYETRINCPNGKYFNLIDGLNNQIKEQLLELEAGLNDLRSICSNSTGGPNYKS